jgi:SAM-dependent methyltransferase
VLPEDTARHLYSQGDSTSRWSTVAFEHQKPQEIVAELSRLFTSGKEHLDVGCSAGSLLDFAKERGCLTTGVDHSSATRNFIEQKGHAWFPSFEALEAKTFDVITAFDLIEHLYNVPLFLQECGRRLRPGGRLVILTGNIESLSARISREHWWYAAYPEHIVFPSLQFFRAHSRYRLERLIPTYAAKAYRIPLIGRIRPIVSGLLRGCYRGLPALGPDHMLLTLCA